MKVFTPEKFPQDYWDIKFNQGNAHLELAEIKDKELNLNLSVKAFEEALKTITPQKSPRPYALTNYFLSKTYFMLSKVKDKETNLEHAIKYLQEYLNLRAEFPATDVREAYKIMGYMLSELGRHAEAINEYRKALKLEPDKPEELHYIIGNWFAVLKQYEEAEKEYRQAIELKPDYVDAHNNLGNVLNNLERFREAEEEYVKALELNPSLLEPHYNLGYLFNTLGRYKEAESEYREVLKLNAYHLMARNKLAIVLYDLGRYDEAEIEYRTTLRLEPDFPTALYNLGFLLKKLKRFREAEWAFKEALKLLKRRYVEAFMPNYPKVPIDTHLLVKELVRYEEIENTTRKRLKLDIKVNVWQVLLGLSELHVEMASGTWDMDLFQDALDELNLALKISRENPQAYGTENLLKMYLLRGKIHTDLEDYARAKSDYMECENYDPHDPMVKRNLIKINKLIDEKAPMKGMQIAIILFACGFLIASFLVCRMQMIRLTSGQFTFFASLCLAFVMLGITLPLIKTIKIGHIGMEFQKFEKPARPKMELRRLEEKLFRPEMEMEWRRLEEKKLTR